MGFDFTSELDDLGLTSHIEELTIDNEKKLIYEELEGTYMVNKAKLHNDRSISNKYDYTNYGRISSCEKAVITNSMIDSNGRCRWTYYGRPLLTYIENVKSLKKIEKGDCVARPNRLEILNNPDLVSINTICRAISIKRNPNLVDCFIHLSNEGGKYSGIELKGTNKLKNVSISLDNGEGPLDLIFLTDIRKNTKIHFNCHCMNNILQIINSNIDCINGILPISKRFYIGKSTMRIQEFLQCVFHSEYVQIGLEAHAFHFENREGKKLYDALDDAIHNNECEEDFFFIPEMEWSGSLDTTNGYVFTGEYQTTKDPKKVFSSPYVKVNSYALFNPVPMLKVCPKKNQIKILV